LRTRDVEKAPLVRRALRLDVQVDVEARLQGFPHPHDVARAVDRPLGVRDQLRVDGGDVPRRAHRRGEMLPVRHHAIDDAHVARLRRGDPVQAEQDDLLGALRPDDPRQDHGHDAGTELELRLAEHRVLRGDGDIAGHRELHAAREARAVHGGDGRQARVPEAHGRLELVP
jgi:hypothetical protein